MNHQALITMPRAHSKNKVEVVTHDLKILELSTMLIGGEEWVRVFAKNDKVELVITNVAFSRASLGGTLRVQLSVIPGEGAGHVLSAPEPDAHDAA